MSPGDRRSPDDETASSGDRGSTTSDGEAGDGRVDAADSDRDGTDPSADGNDRSGSEESAERASADQFSERTSTDEPVWRRVLTATDGPLLLLREVAISFGIVLLIGLLLFGVSGVWPPMVAVESESMEPNINKYDLILVTEPGRFAPPAADETGVVTLADVDGGGHESFDRPGSVVVYKNPNSFGPPIIHRAHFFVEAGENWHDRANPDYISAGSCGELNNCPAPHAGYITKGDNEASNGMYDQANGIAPVVKPGWITGIAQLRLPKIGYIRLALTGAASFGPLVPAGLGAIGASGAYAIGRRDLLG